MNLKYFLFAYPGTGKTFISDNYSNAAEVEITPLKWLNSKVINGLPIENQKLLPNRTRNPEYPANYIDAALKALDRFDVVMAPLIYEAFDYLVPVLSAREDVKIILAFPELTCLEEYVARWTARGNNRFFMDIHRNSFYTHIQFFQKIKTYDQIVLRPAQFLDDAITEYGIKLQPKASLVAVY